MTTKTLDEARARQKVIDERHIKFRPDIDPDKWPPTHQRTFGHIIALGSTLFNSWVEDVSPDWRNSPWKLDTQQRAREVFETARHCRDQEVNERVWRSKLEPFILQRLDKDISCRHCAARLWRSHIEAVADPQEEFAPRLSRAQEDRVVCQCPLEGPDRREAKFSKIFDSREEYHVKLDAKARSQLCREYEVPDKVYALRQIGTLRRLLRQEDTREGSAGQTLQETLSPSLSRHEVHPIVFPFLLVESKSSRSSGSFQDIDRQIAFMVEQCLLIQDRLRTATGSRSKWFAGPTVWCFSHKGPWWRLSVGYMPDGKKNTSIEILKLWEADITYSNGGIQLLLIVDYICDWARSVHREAIIRELQKLAPLPDNVSELLSLETLSVNTYQDRWGGDGMSQARRGSQHLQTPIIMSNIRNPPQEVQERLERMTNWQVAQEDPHLDTVITNDPFRQYDSLYGVIRDANYIRSKVLGLYITESTFVHLAQCRPTDEQCISVLRRIRRRLEVEEPVLVDQSTLNDLEANWSGYRREWEFQVHDNPQKIFQVIFTVSAYINADWSLTRELCYVAISKSAKGLLHKKLRVEPDARRKGYMRDRVWMKLKVQPPSKVADLFASFLKTSTTSTMTACLYRSCLQPKFTDLYDYDTLISRSDGRVICAMDAAPKACSRNIAWFLYRHHRIGRNEPSTPFLRTSQRVENLRSLQVERMGSNPWTSYISPSEKAIISPSEKAIAAYSTNQYGNVLPETAVCCIYILDRMQVTSLVEDLVLERTTFPYCFVTQRLSPSSGGSIDWNVSYDTSQGRGLKNDTSQGRGLKKVNKLIDFLTATIFQTDDEESGETSDEEESGETSDEEESGETSDEGNNTEDSTDEDGSSEDKTTEDKSDRSSTDETEGEGTDRADGDDSDKSIESAGDIRSNDTE